VAATPELSLRFPGWQHVRQVRDGGSRLVGELGLEHDANPPVEFRPVDPALGEVLAKQRDDALPVGVARDGARLTSHLTAPG
jgi:hypothetical protein